MRVDKYVMLVATMMPLIVAVLAILFFGLLLLTLEGCSGYPHKGYYELEEAIEKAETTEEREHYSKQADRIEMEVEKAQLFIEQYDFCLANSTKCKVVCVWHGPYLRDPFNFERHDVSDIEKLYRWWMKVRPPTCGFLTNY